MTVDDRRFLRRHLPSFLRLTPAQALEVARACDGDVVDLRSDGVVFYRPEPAGTEVWVGWLERTDDGLRLKASPPARSLGTLAEYEAEIDTRQAEGAKLLGSKARLR